MIDGTLLQGIIESAAFLGAVVGTAYVAVQRDRRRAKAGGNGHSAREYLETRDMGGLLAKFDGVSDALQQIAQNTASIPGIAGTNAGILDHMLKLGDKVEALELASQQASALIPVVAQKIEKVQRIVERRKAVILRPGEALIVRKVRRTAERRKRSA